MRWFAFIAAVLMAASSARAAGGVECVKTQCEGKGSSCVETLYVAYDACMKAGNTKLRDRATRIVMAETGVDQAQAVRALDESGWVVRDAVQSLSGKTVNETE